MSDFERDNINENFAPYLLPQNHKWGGIIMEY